MSGGGYAVAVVTVFAPGHHAALMLEVIADIAGSVKTCRLCFQTHSGKSYGVV